jgi:ATP-dependent Lon protease
VFSIGQETSDRNYDLCQIGTAAKILSVANAPGDSQLVTLQGIRRIALSAIKKKRPYLLAKIDYIEESSSATDRTRPLAEEIVEVLEKISKLNPSVSGSVLSTARLNLEDPGYFADRIMSLTYLAVESRQQILEALKIDTRLSRLLKILKQELSRNQQTNTGSGTRAIDENEEEYFCTDHSLPLGTESTGIEGKKAINSVSRFLENKVKLNKNIPLEVYDRCLIEIDRLSHLSTSSAEYGTTRRYIDWLLGIPWNICGRKNYDLKRVEKDINREYYGSQGIKKQILERIAVRKLLSDMSDGPILCLAGMAGTGKASLAKAIAIAMGKKFARISVGGIDDKTDIKGTPRTYSGAAPGIIIRTLKDTGRADSVILIEDIEYFTEETNSSLPMSLLEAIDPRYNSRFLDNYIGVPIDLSRTFFICAIKSSEQIPEIFNHRFETIELPGYIEKEKIHIARKYLIPRLLKKHGLLKKDLVFNENGLLKIIRNFTLEAGLLKFRRRLERICRHVAREKATKSKKTWIVNEKTVENFLGTLQYIPEKPDNSPEVGVAIGLAWTGMGGDLMTIEGLRMKGSGEVISTGSLGDVMKESIQAAHSYVRSKADILGIDHNDFDNFDIHIHFPSGAIPKDGPSAGVAVSLAIASVMAERPIRNDIAMTGEVTLRGKVLQVGGLVEKISAAYRAGLRTVFIPKENEKDLKELPSDILKKTKFILIEAVDEIFAKGLLDFAPSNYTLEKIFAEEMEKAKNRKKVRSSRKISAKSPKKK